MQTFLPYKSFTESLSCLDDKRLGKQRVEAYQILRVLCDPTYTSQAWRNHPAVLMWKGWENSLAYYYNHSLLAWSNRGFDNIKLDLTHRSPQWLSNVRNLSQPLIFPPWLGDDHFHSSHRAALLAKNPEHYSQFGWKENPIIDYYWPVTKNGEGV